MLLSEKSCCTFLLVSASLASFFLSFILKDAMRYLVMYQNLNFYISDFIASACLNIYSMRDKMLRENLAFFDCQEEISYHIEDREISRILFKAFLNRCKNLIFSFLRNIRNYVVYFNSDISTMIHS